MRIKTSTTLAASPEHVWPLLCDSRMDTTRCCPFRLGVPKPVECRLPAGKGGVGAERQCVSDRGVIRQRITAWEPPASLRFEMADTTLYFRPCVSSIVEEFALEPVPAGTRLTRTTRIETTGFARFPKALALAVGLKFVHLYVFRNWRRSTALRHTDSPCPPSPSCSPAAPVPACAGPSKTRFSSR